MKNKFLYLLIALLFSITGFAQVTNKIQADSVRIFQVGGYPAEIIIENATKAKAGGVLKNRNNGRTEFDYVVDSTWVIDSILFVKKGPVTSQYNLKAGLNINPSGFDSTSLSNRINLKQDIANLSTNPSLGTSNTLYPSQLAVKTYVDNAVIASPSFYTQDGYFDDATRTVYMTNRTLIEKDSANNSYFKRIFDSEGALTLDAYTWSTAGNSDGQLRLKPNEFLLALNDYDNDRGISLNGNDSSFVFDISNSHNQFVQFKTPKVKIDYLAGFPLIGADALGNLVGIDTLKVNNLKPFVFDGTTVGTHWGDWSFGWDGGAALKFNSYNGSNKNEVALSSFRNFFQTTYGTTDTATIYMEADSAYSKILLQAKQIDFRGLLTDNTAPQVLGKDAGGHSVWVDVSGFGGGGGSYWDLSGTMVGASGKKIGTLDNYDFKIVRNNVQAFNFGANLITVGDDYANGNRIHQWHLKYDGNASYGGRGIKIEDVYSGGSVVFQLNPGSGALYITDASGNASYISGAGLDNPVNGSYPITATSAGWSINGAAKLPIYVAGTIPTGTAAYNLAVDASGNVIGVTASSGAVTSLDVQATDVSNSGSGETDLYSYTLPANTLTATNDVIEAEYAGSFISPTSANLKFYVAGTATSFNTITANQAWHLKVIIVRTGTSTARVFAKLTGDFDAALGETITDLTGKDWTISNVIKITGQDASSTKITAKMATIKKVNHP